MESSATNGPQIASAASSVADVGHIPHCYLPAPWNGDHLATGDATSRHLERVLRLDEGDPVTYTDGFGTFGTGTWRRSFVERGNETRVEAEPGALNLAVAPPKGSDRQRFVVEKLAELGVRRLVWLKTRYGEAKPPKTTKAAAWAIGALEQSKGAWLLEIDGPVGLDKLPGKVALAHPGGVPLGSDGTPDTIAIGPAGGWHADEIASIDQLVTLGSRILRTETAAVVAAALAVHG